MSIEAQFCGLTLFSAAYIIVTNFISSIVTSSSTENYCSSSATSTEEFIPICSKDFTFLWMSLYRWTNESERGGKPDLVLKSSIRKSLIETEKAKLKSIAIPAISCGVFGGVPNVCVPLILDAVHDYFNDKKASCIKQVSVERCQFIPFLNIPN